MNTTIACLLGVVLSQAPTAPRVPLQIFVVEDPSGNLVGNAEVAIYAPNGLVIRRGQTGLFGQPYNPEAVEPLDPALRELRVIVRKLRGGCFFTASETLVFERNAWRPKREAPEAPELQRERLTQVAFRAQLGEPPVLPGRIEEVRPVEIWMRLPPIPVCRTAPWQAFVCGGVPYAPPGPPCGLIPPVPPHKAWLPPSVPPTSVPGTVEAEAAIRRQAAVVEWGRPPVPEFEWAPFGSRWVRGPYGMFWMSRVLPEEREDDAWPDADARRQITPRTGENGRVSP